MFKQPLLIALAIVFLAITLTSAQEINNRVKVNNLKPEQIKKAVLNYQKALLHDNPGVRESAIINIMNLKYHYPTYDYRILVNQLENMERAEGTKSLRFMAYVVKNYLLHPERYNWAEEMCGVQQKLFYTIITDKMSQ